MSILIIVKSRPRSDAENHYLNVMSSAEKDEIEIHFNVPPTRMTDLVRNVSDEKIY